MSGASRAPSDRASPMKAGLPEYGALTCAVAAAENPNFG